MIVLVKEPIDPANLFVATAAAGDRPVNNNTGKVISPPPPTTESINAAKNPNTIKVNNNDGSRWNIIKSTFLLFTNLIVVKIGNKVNH